MAFEVRAAIPPASPSTAELRIGVFTDADWRKLLALAREHGFDPRGEYEDLLQPERGETRELPLVAAQELAVALSEALREETSPRAEDDEGWVYDPERGWHRETMIRVGPPGLQVGWAHVRQLGQLAETGPVTIARADEPET
ncbi:hypothetical protein E0L93_09830 [Rubrobacter taiwanensis]|jgi:hypothetical protein|uniref:Uncharacterized protein n=1 Tax=Rubrobacter taiwanensis TaxID=185139 RepID=A0A4R1BGX1_9ACTN|nr:hypothetical protein [Rubrobacter taiwanensis]TCJ16417.1 hypothetical protein E0L93_09830 [Rubrobacter taiwanensis]